MNSDYSNRIYKLMSQSRDDIIVSSEEHQKAGLNNLMFIDPCLKLMIHDSLCQPIP